MFFLVKGSRLHTPWEWLSKIALAGEFQPYLTREEAGSARDQFGWVDREVVEVWFTYHRIYNPESFVVDSLSHYEVTAHLGREEATRWLKEFATEDRAARPKVKEGHLCEVLLADVYQDHLKRATCAQWFVIDKWPQEIRNAFAAELWEQFLTAGYRSVLTPKTHRIAGSDYPVLPAEGAENG